jgi:hypothetical protein
MMMMTRECTKFVDDMTYNTPELILFIIGSKVSNGRVDVSTFFSPTSQTLKTDT